jgi:hypothetical protein
MGRAFDFGQESLIQLLLIFDLSLDFHEASLIRELRKEEVA